MYVSVCMYVCYLCMWLHVLGGLCMHIYGGLRRLEVCVCVRVHVPRLFFFCLFVLLCSVCLFYCIVFHLFIFIFFFYRCLFVF